MLLLTGIWIYSANITKMPVTGDNSPVLTPRSKTLPNPSPKRRKIQGNSPNKTPRESPSVSRRIDLSPSRVGQSSIITKSLSRISAGSPLMRQTGDCTDPSDVPTQGEKVEPQHSKKKEPSGESICEDEIEPSLGSTQNDPVEPHQDDKRESPVASSQDDQADTPTGSAGARSSSVEEPPPPRPPKQADTPPKVPLRRKIAHMQSYNLWSNDEAPEMKY